MHSSTSKLSLNRVPSKKCTSTSKSCTSKSCTTKSCTTKPCASKSCTPISCMTVPGARGLPGPKGPPGPEGPQGPQGPPGEMLEYFTGTTRQCINQQSVLQPSITDTNVDVVIVTPGNGRLERVSSATDNILYGNCRGNYSLDLQSDRSIISAVAAGDHDNILNGTNNTMSSKTSYCNIINGVSNIIDEYTIPSTNLTLTSIRCGISNGSYNLIKGCRDSSIMGGTSNTTFRSSYADIINGNQQVISSSIHDTISNGSNNNLTNVLLSTINNGTANVINSNFVSSYHTINNGNSNSINTFNNFGTELYNTIINGSSNNITNAGYCTIIGGEGINLIQDYSVAMGKYNNPGNSIDQSESYLGARRFMIGNGTDNFNRFNVFSVNNQGLVLATGPFETAAGADYAEYFESADGSRIPSGTSIVILPTRKIRQALHNETPHGVISQNPAFIANSQEEYWIGKYLKDENGNIIYENVTYQAEDPITQEIEITEFKYSRDLVDGSVVMKRVPSKKTIKEIVMEDIDVYDENNNKIDKIKVPKTHSVTKTKSVPKLSPYYDPTKTYIPRSQRQEWHTVALIGAISILNDQPVAPNWIRLYDVPSNAGSTMYFIK